jgi:bacillithiol biosynthesis cysteine-adding enzyme BshC
VKLNIAGIPFSEIPGQSALFTAYLDDPLLLRAYYPNVVEDPLDAAAFIPSVIQNYKTDRSELCTSLAALNTSLGASSRTMANIDLLRSDDTVAVVTGQQAGLFGGPLYTLYKALSAIKLAEEMNATGVTAVPVFWMATEDHDLEEVASTYFLDHERQIYKAGYKPIAHVENCPVGKVEIDESISQVFDNLRSGLSTVGFSSDSIDVLRRYWKSGMTFGSAFGATILSLLSDYGLIMLDPLDPDLKRLAGPIYAKAIERSDDIVASILERDIELKRDGFDSQVLVEGEYFPLFWHDDNGGRMALRKVGPESFRPRGQTTEFSRGDLLKIAEEDPARFSPGVMLRPAVQDYLLPAVAYFGGGAEISYFAQNSVVYEVLERPVTPIFHRQSFTVVEPKSKKVMEKLSLQYSDLLKKPEAVTLDWAADNLDAETSAAFLTAEESVTDALLQIGAHVGKIDITLLDNLAKRQRKMSYHINAIKKKALLALSRKNGHAERWINQVFTNLMPNGHLQERSINAFSFIHRYGPEFIKWIYEAVDLTDKRHRFLEISNE